MSEYTDHFDDYNEGNTFSVDLMKRLFQQLRMASENPVQQGEELTEQDKKDLSDLLSNADNLSPQRKEEIFQNVMRYLTWRRAADELHVTRFHDKVRSLINSGDLYKARRKLRQMRTLMAWWSNNKGHFTDVEQYLLEQNRDLRLLITNKSLYREYNRTPYWI